MGYDKTENMSPAEFNEFNRQVKIRQMNRLREELGEAVKADEDKLRFDLLPLSGVSEIVKVLNFGAKKYQDHNWRKGLKWGRLFSATIRHLFAWAGGEDLDKESGLSHLAHAACNILFLLEHTMFSLGEDDRWKY